MILETILALTPLDYDHLARAVQVEAASNTKDEYCVAVSILNRVRSPYFPDTCLLYTSPSPRDRQKSRMPSSA